MRVPYCRHAPRAGWARALAAGCLAIAGLGLGLACGPGRPPRTVATSSASTVSDAEGAAPTTPRPERDQPEASDAGAATDVDAGDRVQGDTEADTLPP